MLDFACLSIFCVQPSELPLSNSLTIAARVLVWWTILRICIEERLVYRADFALGTLMRFLPIVTQIFLWQAITNVKEEIAGY